MIAAALLQEIYAKFQDLGEDQVNKGEFNTFSHGYLVPGDLIYLPFGHVVCEKATKSHNISLRTTSLLVTPENDKTANFLGLAFPE